MTSTDSARAIPRSIGLLYLLMGIPGYLNLMYFPGRFIVPGNATATARNIAAGDLTYRLGTLSGLVSNIAFLFLALSLYDLFKDVDRKQARLLLVLVTVSAAIGIGNLVNEIAPLILMSRADFLAVFTRPQLEALAFGFLRLRDGGLSLDAAFWGLWLFPFGILVIRSRFIPKLIGVCLIIGGFAYLIFSFTALALPAYRHVVAQLMLPFYAVGELPIITWLLAKTVSPGRRPVLA